MGHWVQGATHGFVNICEICDTGLGGLFQKSAEQTGTSSAHKSENIGHSDLVTSVCLALESMCMIGHTGK